MTNVLPFATLALPKVFAVAPGFAYPGDTLVVQGANLQGGEPSLTATTCVFAARIRVRAVVLKATALSRVVPCMTVPPSRLPSVCG